MSASEQDATNTGNLFLNEMVLIPKPTNETMRLSFLILLTGLSLACSSAEAPAADQNTDTTTPTETMTVPEPTSEAIPATEENIELKSVEPVPASVPVSSSSSAKSTTPNVQLAETEEPAPERPSGPTLTEAAGPQKPTGNQPTVMVEEGPAPEIIEKSEPDHAIWDNLLRNFVSSSGQVNYRGIKSSPGPLTDYLKELESFPPQSSWSRNQIMAYWINAYNAYTIKLIVDNYPVNSIKDIHGGDPWNQKWIKIGGSTYSLNQIENDILRARYGDARIHFAVNCAAASCPPIHNRAFTADNLDAKLQRLTRNFINNSSYNSISSKRIEISKIFEWYAGDFGNVKSYINGFTDVEVGEGTQVGYKEYDWALNGR